MKSNKIVRNTLILIVLIGLMSKSNCQSASTLSNGTCADRDRLHTTCFIWLKYEDEFGNSISPEIVDFYLCSHYVAGFARIDYNGRKEPLIYHPENAGTGGKKFLLALIEKSRVRPNLQFLLSIGGLDDYDSSFPHKYCQLIDLHELEFLSQVSLRLTDTGVDGIDFYWNWIGRYGPIEKDLKCLLKITKSLCKLLKKIGKLCMITLRGLEKMDFEHPDPNQVELVENILKEADMVNIWTTDLLETTLDTSIVLPTDFLPSFSFSSTHQSNLSLEKSPLKKFNVPNLVGLYQKICNGNRKVLRKLSMVIATHSRAYAVKSGTKNQMDFEIPDVGAKELSGSLDSIRDDFRLLYPFCETCGRWKGQRGEKVSYHEYPEFDGLAVVFNNTYKSSGIHGFATFLPTPKSVAAKAAFAREAKLGGVTIFQIGADDAHGWCFNQSYPLVHAINRELTNCRFY